MIIAVVAIVAAAVFYLVVDDLGPAHDHGRP